MRTASVACVRPQRLARRLPPRAGRVAPARARTVVRASEKPSSDALSNLDAVLTGQEKEEEVVAAAPDAPLYDDEVPERDDGVSDAMKARLRNELQGFGGSPNKPLDSNIFLNISIGVGVFVIVCKLVLGM
mmetsp:Transcript_22177/g.71854  ORF Transcript_22177/g.71854 Transcript_22177/m.71854 type:complete len:131 (+) Transcript_22177:905-1297(+)